MTNDVEPVSKGINEKKQPGMAAATPISLALCIITT